MDKIAFTDEIEHGQFKYMYINFVLLRKNKGSHILRNDQAPSRTTGKSPRNTLICVQVRCVTTKAIHNGGGKLGAVEKKSDIKELVCVANVRRARVLFLSQPAPVGGKH